MSRRALGAPLTYRLFDFSSDVGVEAEARSVPLALIDLGRGLAHVVSDGSKIEPAKERAVDVEGTPDLPGTAVAFLNELAFLFDTEQFLVADGELVVEKADDVIRVRGTLLGEAFDPARHQAGRGVKAATYHDAMYIVKNGMHRFRIVLDL
jgi:SHS2 domain-containing protein